MKADWQKETTPSLEKFVQTTLSFFQGSNYWICGYADTFTCFNCSEKKDGMNANNSSGVLICLDCLKNDAKPNKTSNV